MMMTNVAAKSNLALVFFFQIGQFDYESDHDKGVFDNGGDYDDGDYYFADYLVQE